MEKVLTEKVDFKRKAWFLSFTAQQPLLQILFYLFLCVREGDSKKEVLLLDFHFSSSTWCLAVQRLSRCFHVSLAYFLPFWSHLSRKEQIKNLEYISFFSSELDFGKVHAKVSVDTVKEDFFETLRSCGFSFQKTSWAVWKGSSGIVIPSVLRQGHYV